jgi:hypothetical protein
MVTNILDWICHVASTGILSTLDDLKDEVTAQISSTGTAPGLYLARPAASVVLGGSSQLSSHYHH